MYIQSGVTNLDYLKIQVVIFNRQGTKLHYEFLLCSELWFGKMIFVFATTCSAFIQLPSKRVHRALSLEISVSNVKLTNSFYLLLGARISTVQIRPLPSP